MKITKTIVTCDRCGKEIDVGPLDQASWFQPVFVYMKGKMQLRIRGGEKCTEVWQKECEFCQECTDTFYEWINSGGKAT